MIAQIKPNETSFPVVQLHLVMQLLQLPIKMNEQEAKKAGPATQETVRAWQAQEQLPVNPELLIDTATSAALSKALKNFGYLENDLRNSVSGKVVKESGNPIQKITVWVFDLDLKGVGLYKDLKFTKELLAAKEGFEFLGAAISSKTGYFEVIYYDWMYTKSERRCADVVAFAIQGDDIVGRSALQQNTARNTQDVRVVVPTIKRAKGAYKPLYKTLISYLDINSMSLADIGHSQDYTNFIAGELDLELEKLNHLVSAHHLNDSTAKELEPELLYGLARQKTALQWERLYRSSVEVLELALMDAIKENDIDNFAQSDIDNFLDTLHTCAAEKVLQPQGNTPNIGDELLKLSLSNPEDRVLFAKLKAQYSGNDENDFWENYMPQHSNFDQSTLKSLRNNQSLFLLSELHLPLVQEINKTEIQEPSQLVTWDIGRWIETVKISGVSSNTKGKDPDEKIKNYATALQKKLNTEFTHAAIQLKIATQNIQFSSPAVTSNIVEFLNTEQDFDIKTDNIHNYKDQLMSVVGPDKKLQKQVLDETMELQRMVRLNPDTSKISVMKDLGLTSAMVISQYPKRVFVANYGDLLGEEEALLEMYDRATTYSTTMNMVTSAISTFADDHRVGTLKNPVFDSEIFDIIEERFPGYSEVFNVNLCECQHCNSVYSPAAYFVDLMQYLKHGGINDDGDSPLKIFRDRRPDLFHLPLTCENSNTLIPYIDLANEVMESYIYYTEGLSPPGETFENYKSEDTGDLTADELRAQPQFVKKETYFKLSEATFPLTMPYHLPWETLRAYSEQMGTTWYEVLKTIQTPPVSEDIPNFLIANYLNLTERDYEILVGSDFLGNLFTLNLANLYGFATSIELEELAEFLTPVTVFLKQTGLKYTELVALFKTNFINPGLYLIPYLDFLFRYRAEGETTGLQARTIYTHLNELSPGTGIALSPEFTAALASEEIIEDDFREWVRANFDEIKQVLTLYQADSACDLSTTEIRKIENIYDVTTENLSGATLRKLLRFIRLWRKTGWSIPELDAITSALSTGGFDAAFLEKFSSAKQFIDITSLSPKKAAVLWGDIDYRFEDNLYAELFLNRSLEISEVFIPKPEADLFEGLAAPNDLQKYHSDLLAVFKITEKDLGLIYAHDVGISKTDTITIAHISMLYRYVLMAEVCKITIGQLLSYTVVFGLDLFGTPLTTLTAYNEIKKVKATKFSIEDFAYIFSSITIPHGFIIPEDSAIIATRALLPLEYTAIDNREIVIEEGDVEMDVRENLKRQFTYSALSDLMSLTPEETKALVEPHVSTPTISEALIDNLIEPEFIVFIKGILRSSIVANRFQLDSEEVAYFTTHKADFDNLDLLNLTLDKWKRLFDYATIRDSLPQTENKLISIFGSSSPGEAINLVTNWNASDVDYLLTKFTGADAFKNEQILVRMERFIRLSQKMGIAVESISGFNRVRSTALTAIVRAQENFDGLWEQSRKLKRLLKAKYDQSTWNSVATKLNDTLREQRRDALVAYLLQMESIKNPDLGIVDANGLYEFFLLDVQMSACMETTRIVQANAAIQQFVIRTHLNLEKKVKVEALVRNRWAWMKHYRVWEAQMRVWYENETLLNPEWRMDKSPFFKELESHLTQNDITDRTAEEALRGYLKNMDEVSNLNVAGMYEETVANGNLKIVHVFGHTNNTPYTYYYRTYNQYGKWSPWEKVDAAIQAVSYSDADHSDDEKKTGVHLIPVVWKNRLILFWPEFLEKVEPVNTEGKTFEVLAKTESTTSQQPKKYWEVRLAWSESYDNKWTAKQVSEEFIKLKASGFYPGQMSHIGLHNLSFISLVDFDSNVLKLIQAIPTAFAGDIEGDSKWGFRAFEVANMSEKPQISYLEIIINGTLTEIHDDILFYYKNKFLQSKYKTSFTASEKKERQFAILKTYLSNPIEHQILFPNQLQYNDNPVSYPFFYSVKGKNYFVNTIQRIIGGYYAYDYEEGLSGVGGGIDFVLPSLRQFLNFNTFHHPFVSDFISNLNKNGIGTHDLGRPGLMESDTLSETADLRLYDDGGSGFLEFRPNWLTVFKPADLDEPNKTYYKETIDFDPYGANSYLNWELFYHAPLYIATQLSKNGKHQEALKWFHYIFDPTTDEPVPEDAAAITRFFKVKPFKTTPLDSFETFIRDLVPRSIGSREHKKIEEWKNNPFNPHLVASNFPVNYMKHVVLAYVENLVHWGDNLFRKFTRENLYEAIQHYVIAGHILGPKPQFVSQRGVVKRESYDSISSRLNELSNAYVSLENSLPYSSDSVSTATGESATSLLGIGSAFYFCMPPNEKLMKYWDLVEDRLYKIRHCKDINGVARRLALFAPRIDPAALIAARSAGISLDDILDDLYPPNPHYRFSYLLQRANEFCNDVKALGAAVLSAIEKKEGEELGRLRTTHEVVMLGMVQKIKERQILDARTAKELLETQRETTIYRFNYYNETLLGNEAVEIPSIIDLAAELDEDSQITVNPDMQNIVPDVSVALTESGETGVKLISKENTDIDLRSAAKILSVLASGGESVAAVAATFPELNVDTKPFGVGGGTAFSGQNVAFGAELLAKTLQTASSVLSQEAAMASTFASYIRREQDWTLQANLAAKECQQLERKILSAGIRVQIAEKDLENHKRQIEHAETIENYLKEKFSNTELYQWMKEQLVSVHKQSYDLAFQLAKQAEMAFGFEKGLDVAESPYITYGYDNSKCGLTAGEQLQLALRQLEVAYQVKNVREFELTKNISLRRLNPEQLINLKATGKIIGLEIPEWLFNLDCPGHYKRRIKRVGISIPAVAGPYSSLNCKLMLSNSNVRINPDLDPDSIKPTLGAINAIVTSNAQNDDGMFESNFRDERYLPFEGAGVISTWDLELPEFKQFDYNTISDVIFHISYTAIDGGNELISGASTFKEAVIENYNDLLSDVGGQGLFRLFDLKHDFPNEWHLFNTGETTRFEAVIQDNHFPYYASTAERRIIEKNLYTVLSDGSLVPNNLGTSDMTIEIDEAVLDRELESFVVVKFAI